MSSIIAYIKPALRVPSDEPTVEFLMFRLLKCEEALRSAIKFAEDVRDVKRTFTDERIINDHIAQLASVECPEEWRQ